MQKFIAMKDGIFPCGAIQIRFSMEHFEYSFLNDNSKTNHVFLTMEYPYIMGKLSDLSCDVGTELERRYFIFLSSKDRLLFDLSLEIEDIVERILKEANKCK